MAFSHIIAHQLERNSPTAALTLKTRPDVFTSNGKIEEIARELKHNYIKKSGKAFGRFATDTAAHPFSQWLKEYREQKIGFSNLTQTCLTQLKLEIEKTEAVLYGQLFFMQEILEGDQYLYVVLVENSSGQYLDGDLNLSDSIYLDTQGFNLAARIHLNEWEAGDNVNYVSLLRWRGEKELSDMFANFIGFTDKIDPKAQTQELLEMVEQFTQQLDIEAASFTRSSVVNYCLEQAKQDRPVVLQELTSQVQQEQVAPFSEFIRLRSSAQQQEIIPEPSALRQYVRLSGRNEQLSMSFASDCLGQSITYDTESDSLIIKNIPPALKTRLIKHLKNKH